MSATNPQRVNSHASRGNVSQAVTRFVEATEDLAVELDAPDNVVAEFVDAGEDLADLVEETAQQSDTNRERIEDNAEEIEEVDENHGTNIGGCHARISSVEDEVDTVADEVEQINVEDADVGSQTQGSTVENHPTTEPQTSLEHVVGLDEKIIEENLTVNQQRARHVATDPRHYGEKTGKGWMLTSGDISKVLRSGTDCDGRTQTVSRVMDFLDRLGGDEVEVTTHRGTRRVYFSEEITDRLTALATSDNGVVTSQPVGAVI